MDGLRCQGVVMPSKQKEMGSLTLCFSGWRCVLCGSIIDSVIDANRKCHQESMSRRAHLLCLEPRAEGVG
jgi:hypothetical protein